MARAAKATKTTKPTVMGRQPNRLATTAAKPSKVTKPATAPKRAPAAAAPAPKPSKDELRVQVEKLERTNARLRAKHREAGRAAKTAAARVAELEQQVARLEATLASQSAPAQGGAKSATAARTAWQRRSVDLGSGMPPGVAVQEPVPLDEEAKTARENLEEHLGGR